MEWDAFEVKPQDERYCPPVAVRFTATSTEDVTSSADLASRSAIISYPVLVTNDLHVSVAVTEAVYAVNAEGKSDIFVENTMQDVIIIKYVPPLFEEEQLPANDTALNQTESASGNGTLSTDGETTDFGELEDDFGEITVYIPTLANWIKPKPSKRVNSDGELYLPPPVTIKVAEASESGGIGLTFARPVIVPPFFEGKGTRAETAFRLL